MPNHPARDRGAGAALTRVVGRGAGPPCRAGPYNATPIFVKEAQGRGPDGRGRQPLLDFAGGIGCLNVGHAQRGGGAGGPASRLERFTSRLLPCHAVRALRRAWPNG